jgi:hypothetical protein
MISTNFIRYLGISMKVSLQATARYYSIKLKGTIQPCVHCAVANLGQLPISKQSTPQSSIPGDRIFIDISKFSHQSTIGSKYWLLIVDDATDYTWSLFLKEKSNQYDWIVEILTSMKSRGTPVSSIRCDNSGENNYLTKLIKIKGFNIKFEFTSPSTPQQKRRVERKFSILYRYMRALLHQAQLNKELKEKLWPEAAHHSTDIINAICTSKNKIPPYKLFYKEDPMYMKHLRRFGELVATTTQHNKIKSESKDRGFLALYIGRAKDHPVDTYLLLNLTTQRVIINQNVKFLDQMYGEYFNKSNQYHALSDNEEVDEDAEDDYVISYPQIKRDKLINEIDVGINVEQPDFVGITEGPVDQHQNNFNNGPNMKRQTRSSQKMLMNNDIDSGKETPKKSSQTSRLSRERKRLNGFFNPTATSLHENLQFKQPTVGTMIEKDVTKDYVPANYKTIENDSNELIQQDIPTQDESQQLTDHARSLICLCPMSKIYNVSTLLISSKQIDSNPYNVAKHQLKDIVATPITYEEAYYCPDEWCRKRWQEAIRLELNKMNILKVREPVDFNNLPNGQKPIKNKRVFNIKRTGVFRARLVACGYSQIP